MALTELLEMLKVNTQLVADVRELIEAGSQLITVEVNDVPTMGTSRLHVFHKPSQRLSEFFAARKASNGIGS